MSREKAALDHLGNQDSLRKPRGCSPQPVRLLSPSQVPFVERGQSFTQEEALERFHSSRVTGEDSREGLLEKEVSLEKKALENRVSVITSTPVASPNTSQSFYQLAFVEEPVFENTMENKKKELVKARSKLLREKQITTVVSVTFLNLEEKLKITREIRNEVQTFAELLDDFMVDYTDQEASLNDFKVESDRVIDEVIAHLDKVEARAAEVKEASTNEAIETAVNVSQQSQVAQLQDLLSRQATLDSTREVNIAKNRAITKSAQVRSDVEKLDAELRKVHIDNWCDLPDKDIVDGISKLEEWQSYLDSIIKNYR